MKWVIGAEYGCFVGCVSWAVMRVLEIDMINILHIYSKT